MTDYPPRISGGENVIVSSLIRGLERKGTRVPRLSLSFCCWGLLLLGMRSE